MLAVVAFALAALAGPARDAPATRAVFLVQRVEAHHAQVRDMKGRFVQTYASGLLGRELVERGTLAIKRPGRMMWKYEQPEEKLFVSDGVTTYFYVPADRQVIVRPSRGARGLALDLLSSRSDLLREFQAFTVSGSPDRVRLVPQGADPDVREVLLDVDPRGRIVALEVLDLEGNRSTFRFEGIEENVGLPDSLFQFKIPGGVEVVSG